MKLINSLKKEADSSPVYMAVAMLAVALSCILLPVSWLEKFTGGMYAGAIYRFVFGIAGIAFVLSFGAHFQLTVGKPAIKNIDVALVCLIIAVNNFPLIGLISGGVKITAADADVFAYIVFCISVGFFEEIFFRGLIFPLLIKVFRNKKAGILLAVLISSATFGLIHLVNLFGGGAVGAVLMQVGYSTLIGAMLAVLFYYARTIWLPVIIHALFDVGGLMTSYIAEGKIWSLSAIILTATLSAAVGIYLLIRFIRTSKNLPKNI
jgi:membrane protease YdiL (CAAX protease family)